MKKEVSVKEPSIKISMLFKIISIGVILVGAIITAAMMLASHETEIGQLKETCLEFKDIRKGMSKMQASLARIETRLDIRPQKNYNEDTRFVYKDKQKNKDSL